jgi:hypothetical protein
MNLVEDLHNTHKLEYIGGHQYLVPKVSTACRQSSIKYLTYKSDGHTYGETVIQTLPAVNFIADPSLNRYMCISDQCVAQSDGLYTKKANCEKVCGKTAQLTTAQNLYINGYYGNEGHCQSTIKYLSDTPDAFNIITLTFIQFDTDGYLEFVIQGADLGDTQDAPYGKATAQPWCHTDAKPLADRYERLYNDIQKWKQPRQDKWNRPRYVLVSLGGSVGSNNWPPAHLKKPKYRPTDVQISNMIIKFIETYELDGLDIDLEKVDDDTIKPIMQTIKDMKALSPAWTHNNKYIITCAPEADANSVGVYKDIILASDYVGLQCYNNEPSQLGPGSPNFWPKFNCTWGNWDGGSRWDSGGTQAVSRDTECVGGVLGKEDTTTWNAVTWSMNKQWKIDMAEDKASSSLPYGFLVPANQHAADSHNIWDFNKVVKTLKQLYDSGKLLNIRYIGTWAIECDFDPTPNSDNQFSTAMEHFLEYMQNNRQ